MNAPVQIKQIESAQPIHPIFARSQFHQEFLQNSRIALAHSMQFIEMLPHIRLNISLGDRFKDELASVPSCKWRDLQTREFIQVLPHMADFIRPI